MLGAIFLVLFHRKRRRARKIEPAWTVQFGNPVYGVAEQEPQERDNVYSFAGKLVQVAFSEDGPEGYYEDIEDSKTKDSAKDFEKDTLSFTNPAFQRGSDGLSRDLLIC